MATQISNPIINPTTRPANQAETEIVVAQFERRVLLTPSALAVVSGEDRLTYSELNEKANAVAQALRQHGVGPERLIGILADRNCSFVVGALGILKSGAAYLPLDPSFPPEHLNAVLADSDACALITDTSSSRLVDFGPLVLSIDSLQSSVFDPPDSSLASIALRNIAYVIYTSGSTGKPKGVEILHAGLSNLVRWHQTEFAVTSSDRASQFASPSFDAAGWEIWPYLTVGASVHFVPDSVRANAELLRDWLIENGITLGFVPTPVAESLMSLSWPAHSSLRILLTGADTLHRFPPADLPFQLVNNYGPTEATVVATSAIVSPAHASTELPAIGRPIANTTIHILNEKFEPVPDGEIGEIFIAGPGVARGYRNLPSLTEQRFITHQTGDRLYRTGDLGRILPDGQIAFLGRIDDQIKISGFRIEPAQIVKVLEEHPAIETAAVVARQGMEGSPKLLAYIVEKAGQQLRAQELREFLLLRLPSYMVPMIFVRLARLPLSANGKLDRAALPIPTSSNILKDETAAHPLTAVEERLTAILAKLLGLDSVGAEDNFFNLGGHSLLATQLIARIRDAFGVDLSLRTVFDAPTVAQLAERIESSILEKVASMSEEEAQRLLTTMTDPGNESAQL